MTRDMRPPLLYLVHRIPYPPNKGDKLRSFNILRRLADNYRVFLGCFVDNPDDMQHVDTLGKWCEATHVVQLDPGKARLASLRGLLTGEALSLPYYRDAGLSRWVADVVAREGIREAIAFSGPMAQYLDVPGIERRVVDFCDVDSAKWSRYAEDRSWPMSWLYRREGRCLLDFERIAAARAEASVFVTAAEAALFRAAAPELAERIVAIENGVDSEYFSPDISHPSPYVDGAEVILFTGAMDYWPNIDAVCWFANEILPCVLESRPAVQFHIVGMNPSGEVRALANEHVFVSGTVPDIRPWLAHADVVAAPLRVARGIQNKVLEAMAMAKPVVVSAASAVGLAGTPGCEYATASSAGEFADTICELFADASVRDAMARAGRECVVSSYSWHANLGRFETLLRPVAESSVTASATHLTVSA